MARRQMVVSSCIRVPNCHGDAFALGSVRGQRIQDWSSVSRMASLRIPAAPLGVLGRGVTKWIGGYKAVHFFFFRAPLR
jgi:hypothetical protein